jgi:hypothetical protein
LSPQEHEVLVRQSLNELALRTQTSQDPWALLRNTRAIRESGSALGADGQSQLKALEARLEQQTLRQGVTRIAVLGKEKQLGRAVREAQDWLKRDAAHFPAETKVSTTRLEVRKSLEAVSELGKRIEGLEQVEVALQAQAGKDPQAAAEAFQRVDRNMVPEDLHPAVDGLRGLAELRAAVESPWKGPPESARLQRSLTDLQQAISKLPGQPKDSTLVNCIQQDLAVRAFLEGHSATADALWPAKASPEHAARLLRDMKALLTGKGEVITPLGRQAVPVEPGQGGAPPRGPPPGLKPLLPEGSGEGWRPPVRGAATEGLPPLEEAAQKTQPLRDAVPPRLRQERDALAIHPHFQHLQHLHQQLQRHEQEERLRLKELEKKLAHPLQPAEQAWALQQLQEQPVDEVAKELEKKRTAEDIEKKLERIKSYLDPSLATAERLKKARELLEKGQELADVVVRLSDALSPARRALAGGIRNAVRLDDVAAELESGLDAFEYAQAEQLIQDGRRPAEVVNLIRKQRQRARLRADLERVKSYLDRPLTEEELTRVRRMLEGESEQMFRLKVQVGGSLAASSGPLPLLPLLHLKPDGPKEVADIVASLPEALSPERRNVPGGIREAVLLDEVNRESKPGLDAFEYAQVRQLLRQGAKPADIVAVIAMQRAEAAEKREQVKPDEDNEP